MTLTRWLLLCAASAAGSYHLGCVLGHSIGVRNGKRACDEEWARMLENGMVGPGSTSRDVA